MKFSENEKPSNELVMLSDKTLLEPLKLTKTPGILSSCLTSEEKKNWSKTKVCYNTAGLALNVKAFPDFLEINAKSKNSKYNTEYATIYSFKEMPFYGFSFHPEAVFYEWGDLEININIDLDFSKKMSRFFVDECRNNFSKLLSKKTIIYNYDVYSSDKVLKLLYPENWESMQFKKHFSQLYIFGTIKH
jgi:hypothetical protein